MYELSALDGSQHQTISLSWPFMFRIHLWVVVVALVAVSVAGGGAEDIDAIFPPRLAAVLKKVADAKSIPYGAMISGMLALICALSTERLEPRENVGILVSTRLGQRVTLISFSRLFEELWSLYPLIQLSVWLVAFR
jgi:hypothetical protein